MFATSKRSPTFAHSHGVPLIVDNTVATPILVRPIEYGADIVVHSLTKFMGGHGVAMGGAIVDFGRFDWDVAAVEVSNVLRTGRIDHGLVYSDRFGREAFVARARSVYQRTTGAVLAPMSAFLSCKELRRSRYAWSVMSRTRAGRAFLAGRSSRRSGRLCRLSRQSLS